MFSLIRRFSGSVIPRPDRPWEEDPTSNAPHVGRKRRMADEDRDDDDEEQSRLKKVRAAASDVQPDACESSSTPLSSAKESAAVKEVTQGVKEVDLEEKPLALPETVPLPEETAGELDGEVSSTASTPPPAGEPAETQDAVIETETAPAEAAAELEPALGDVVSEPAAEETKDPVEPSAAAPGVAVDAPTNARPIKKLRAKQKTAVAAEPES
ncbi:hypothetical protein DFH09DRAFT_192787 [Mycena vulgaris]|nr:hypothetical protein DFH09DRAFT_192787 [Mycena vulgaris]